MVAPQTPTHASANERGHCCILHKLGFGFVPQFRAVEMAERRGGAAQRAEKKLKESLAKAKAKAGAESGEARSRSPRRRRGGVAQRVERDAWGTSSGSSGDTEEQEQFKQYCHRLNLSKKLSGVETRELASSAQQAGAKGVERIQKAGAGGRHPGNVQRDLMRGMLRDVQNVPEIYHAEVVVMNQIFQDCSMMIVSCLSDAWNYI